MRAPISLAALLLILPLPGQQSGPPLAPSEALQLATDPFNQARAQNNDLTEADTMALTLGMSRAARDCNALAAAPQAFAEDPNQVLALGRLCLFGQQFEQARASLVGYLALPAPPDRETALILLLRAYLGLNDAFSAGIQVDSLLRDFPYDAEIHLSADQAISASEGWSLDPNTELNSAVKTLCDEQREATLPLLVQGKSLTDKKGTVPASTLYTNALRCVALARSLGDATANNTLNQLAEVVQQANWQHTAELSLMKEGLARAQMIGFATPLVALHAHQLAPNGALVGRTLSLQGSSIILAAFTLWSPSAAQRIRDLAAATPSHSVYAVTSWSANTGGADTASRSILAALLSWQKALPPKVQLLIVPDAELVQFHLDQFPDGVSIGKGITLSNTALADEGAVRLVVQSVQNRETKH